MPHKATVRAGSNIAFIKYWGVDDAALNIPQNNSISMTLDHAHTTTTVEWDAADVLARDQITLDGHLLATEPAQRLVDHLDRMRAQVGKSWRARVVSRNNFPMASGIASSASGFAALTVAGCRALGLALDETQLSALARRGSGSASRSLFGGFVEWERGDDDTSSVARQIFPAEHWPLYDVVAILSRAAKHVSSAGGHTLAASSPLNSGRVASLPPLLDEVRAAIRTRDLARLGPVIELDTLAMHGVMMTSTPSLIYWQGATVEIMQAVRTWREQDGVEAYFTIDAGPNVHLICEEPSLAELTTRLEEIPAVQRLIVSGPGSEPTELVEHLF